ncbi:MAG: universal stress protein [Armatimonadetes bacterium]|nr:universal stress protein [Armatimonadota bacterium]
MYERILIPVDNSRHSKAAVTWGVRLARSFGSSITGLHVFAARLHDDRFKQMEVTLPERYQEEKTLSHQRLVHKD